MPGPMKKTVMVLRVDLQCPCCYKKIQKILCRIPEISDRCFDEKANTVTITVISCNPDKIRAKLRCKGGKCIKSIEDPPKPKPPPLEKPKPQPEKPKPEPEKPKPEPEKPKPEPKPEPHPCHTCCRPCFKGHCGGPCFKCHCGGPCYHGCGCPPPPPPPPKPKPQPPPPPPPQPQPPPPPPPQPQPCHDWNYPCGPGYTYGRPCYVTRCDYFSEENTTGCTIM